MYVRILVWFGKPVTGMDDPSQNETSSFKRFLERFCRDVEEPTSEENDPPVRFASYFVVPSEIEGESLHCALEYLCQTHDCPPSFAAYIARAVTQRVTQLNLFDKPRADDVNSEKSPPEIDLRCLHKEVTAQVHTMCREWNRQLPPFDRPLSRTLQSCAHAIKNTRRKMEDRHIILSDLNTLFNLQSSPSQSYYAVFDGHGGPEAAMYAASQLHTNMVHDAHFHTDPELALKRAYSVTDQQFLSKAKTQNLRSGTTGVSALVRGDRCFVAWLGDSQALLVRDGQAVTLMEPHKPERPDERKRIEDLGGFVCQSLGVWRVSGSISVSRAIGDINQKPFLCSDADVMNFVRTGTEDYLVLGCDGVWDVLAPSEIPNLVYSYLQRNPNQHLGVARHLVAKAKEQGSSDNISAIVVFFRRDIAEPVDLQMETFQFVRENGEQNKSISSGSSQVSSATSSSITSPMLTSATSGNTSAGKTKKSITRFLESGNEDFSSILRTIVKQTLLFLFCHSKSGTMFFRQLLSTLMTGKVDYSMASQGSMMASTAAAHGASTPPGDSALWGTYLLRCLYCVDDELSCQSSSMWLSHRSHLQLEPCDSEQDYSNELKYSLLSCFDFLFGLVNNLGVVSFHSSLATDAKQIECSCEFVDENNNVHVRPNLCSVTKHPCLSVPGVSIFFTYKCETLPKTAANLFRSTSFYPNSDKHLLFLKVDPRSWTCRGLVTSTQKEKTLMRKGFVRVLS